MGCRLRVHYGEWLGMVHVAVRLVRSKRAKGTREKEREKGKERGKGGFLLMAIVYIF